MGFEKQKYYENSKILDINFECNKISDAKRCITKITNYLENKTINHLEIKIKVNFNDKAYIEKNPFTGEERKVNPYHEKNCF